MSPHAYHLYRGNTAGFGKPVVPLIVFNLMLSGKAGTVFKCAGCLPGEEDGGQ